MSAPLLDTLNAMNLDEFSAYIDSLIKRTMDGGMLSREETTALLDLEPDSPKAVIMEQKAGAMAKTVTNGTGRIWSAVGVDRHPCTMNCKFCSFGNEWGLVKDDYKYTKEEVIELAKAYVNAGVTTLTLRSTEFYDVKTLTEWLADIRAAAPGDYAINLNVGELSPAMAEAAYQAGATSAYHVMRMREGVDTPFNPEVRERTIRVIADSPLRFGTCVEPIGIEHTNEELADKIIYNMHMRPYGMGVMFRVNVPGTPFEGYDDIPKERMLQILAVTRIAVGTQIRCMGMHPAMPESLYAGGNSFTVELGANPRDTEFNESEWRNFSAEEAKRVIEEAGFRLETINPDPRFREGATWWHPYNKEADFTMPDPFEGAGLGCCRPKE